MRASLLMYLLIPLMWWSCEEAKQVPQNQPGNSTTPANLTTSQPVTATIHSTTSLTATSTTTTTTVSTSPNQTTATYQPILHPDSITIEDRNYSGEYPKYPGPDGKPIATYSGLIKGAEADTIFFNSHRWNHWPDMSGIISISPQKDVIVRTFFTGIGPDGAREFFRFKSPTQPGIYQTNDLNRLSITPMFHSREMDMLSNDFSLDEQADNWIQIISFQESTSQLVGKFSLHFTLKEPKKLSLNVVYPTSFHMHGSFRN